MKSMQIVILATAVLTLGSLTAIAQEYYENFESYAVGSGIIGQGGWDGWDGDPSYDAYVDIAPVPIGNSLRLDVNSDVVQQFSGFTGDAYLIHFAFYYPGNATGNCYFIVLDEYAHGGPYSWLTQVQIGSGFVEDYDTGDQLPLVTEEWNSIIIEYTPAAVSRIYYNGDLLSTRSVPVPVNIAAIDLFSDDGTEIYYDDIEIYPSTVPTEPTSLSLIKSLY
jgi:hypothetical protein